MSFAVIGAALCIPQVAHAEPWYRGRYGKNRITNIAVTGAGYGIYLSSVAFQSGLNPSSCRWCRPDSLDVSVRNALVWHDTQLAARISTGIGYYGLPLLEVGLVGFSAVLASDGSNARTIDDVVPILETVALGQLAVQAIKLTVGRERPFVHFAPPGASHDPDDDLSFLSGHSALAFGVATAAGVIAHRRHLAAEPYVWATGMALAATTAYLRIAADKHYFTDVLAGSALGALSGLLVPKLMSRESAIIPTGTGAAYVRTF